MEQSEEGGGQVIVLSHPGWWLNHVDELVDALTVGAQTPEPDEPMQAADEEVVIADPAWWLYHLDELTDALATAERIRERQVENARENREPQQPSEPEHTWVDLDALREARQQQPMRDPDRDRDRGNDR